MSPVDMRRAERTVKHVNSDLEEWANPRTIVVLTLFLLGALWSVVVLSAYSAYREHIANTSDLLQHANHAIEEHTRQHLRLVGVLLTACESWLESHPTHDPRIDPDFRRLFERLRMSAGGSVALRLLTTEGTAFEPTSEAHPSQAKFGRDEDLAAVASESGLALGSPTIDPFSHRPVLPVIRRLSKPVQGTAFLLAAVDLSTLRETYERQRQAPGERITLAQRDGTVLLQAPDAASSPQPSIAGNRLFRHHLAQQASAFLVLEASAEEPRSEFVSYSSMPDFPLLIVVTADYDQILAPWLRQTLWTFLLALGLTVPLAVVAYRSMHLLRVLIHRDAQLQHLATTDRLTGISGRQHFVETLKSELQRAHHRHLPLTVLSFDIDFFKRINDGYGHSVGDEVLVAFAKAAKACLRDDDLLGRVGAGEFSILLPGTDVQEATRVAERIRKGIGEISIASDNGTVRFTASVGVSAARTTDNSIDDFLKRVARALHEAKAGGHDRVVVA